MLESFGHVDGTLTQATVTLDAVIGGSHVASVAVVHNGVTVATRARSAHPPVVKIAKPPVFGSRSVLVHWSARDVDGDPLAVEIDYSGDAGRTWNPVWIGPNRGGARLPDRYLFRSAHARLRALVSDGFQTATALSRLFRSPGAPPFVRILTPRPGFSLPNDAPLVLSGQAFDDQSNLLTGRHLRWMLGRRLLAVGEQVTVGGLPPGRHRIDLLARDGAGRVSRASLVVRLRAARPLFLRLATPRVLARTARFLQIAVASSLTARLVVRTAGMHPQQFTVSRNTRRVTVRTLRGRKPTSVRFSLSSGGLTRTVVVVVHRR